MSDQSFIGSCGGIREFTKGVTYHSSRRRAGRHQAYRILHRQQDQLPRPHYGQNCTVWKQSAEDDYLEIDLGAPRFVTHIGTAGVVCPPVIRRSVASYHGYYQHLL